MAFRPLRQLFPAVTLVLGVSTFLQAGNITLYLMDGGVVRGEIVDRSASAITLKTEKGTKTVNLDTLQPVSQQQLRFDAGIAPVKSEDEIVKVEVVLEQMEKLLSENEALKKRIAELEARLQEKPSSEADSKP